MFEVYSRGDIVRFLKAIDKEMKNEYQLILIGGTAATLAYKVTRATHDIDVLNDLSSLKNAIAEAQNSTGIHILVEQVTVHDGPYNMEERLKE
jgi:CRISPR/Cas system CMR-associated protein Cmr5 small subunit